MNTAKYSPQKSTAKAEVCLVYNDAKIEQQLIS